MNNLVDSYGIRWCKRLLHQLEPGNKNTNVRPDGHLRCRPCAAATTRKRRIAKRLAAGLPAVGKSGRPPRIREGADHVQRAS